MPGSPRAILAKEKEQEDRAAVPVGAAFLQSPPGQRDGDSAGVPAGMAGSFPPTPPAIPPAPPDAGPGNADARGPGLRLLPLAHGRQVLPATEAWGTHLCLGSTGGWQLLEDEADPTCQGEDPWEGNSSGGGEEQSPPPRSTSFCHFTPTPLSPHLYFRKGGKKKSSVHHNAPAPNTLESRLTPP